MENHFKTFEKGINKTHKFGWTPKFKEKIRTNLKQRLFIAIAIKSFEKLEWDVIYQDETSVEAKRKGSWNKWTEKITVTFDHGNVIVESLSLGNEFWDIGRNSKRVKLFIHALELTEKEFDSSALENLETELEKADNWDNYEIPYSLPTPPKSLKPRIIVPIIGGIIVSLLTGFLIAFLTFKSLYIIGLFEVGTALLIGFCFKYLIRIGNYTNLHTLLYLLIGVILITFISNQYFLFELIWDKNNYGAISFLEFITIRLKAGLTIDSLNTGWIGLVISWIFQLVFTFFILYLIVVSSVTRFLIKRVPEQVTEFTLYHFVKGKSEDQVRSELAKMGWVSEQSQDEAIGSIVGLSNAQEINRME